MRGSGATLRCKRKAIGAAFLLVLLAGCAGTPVERPPIDRPPVDGPPTGTAPTLPPDATPRPEPRSRYGNPPFYEVNGRRYEVLASGDGYQERGVASWYGQKFHGRPTSSQEPYDMHAMTAAHRTLPLPTWVRVRNLANGSSVIVRVNDRGPFVDNRIIDLSYAAALALDMIRDGTSLVEVTALGFGEPDVVTMRASAGAAEPPPGEPEPAGEARIFVQVGAFGDIDNARRRHELLRDGGITASFVHEDGRRSPALYRVRIGPIADATEYDSIVAELHRLGIAETHLVTE